MTETPGWQTAAWLSLFLLCSNLIAGCAALRQGSDGHSAPLVVERFEFTVQPTDLSAEEATRRVLSVVDESMEVRDVEHIGWLVGGGGEGPDSRIDFFWLVGTLEDEPLGGPQRCQMTVWGFGSASMGCGHDDNIGDALLLLGSGGNDRLGHVDFVVNDKVASVVGTTADGTQYTATPRRGFGYLEYVPTRGTLELVAFDAQGNEMHRIADAGL